MTLIDIARLFSFVREVPQNRGQRVEAIQKWSGGGVGDSWCCEMTTMWLDLFYAGNSPIPRLQACQDVYNMAKAKGWLATTPSIGDVFLYVNAEDHAHHIGIVTTTIPLQGIAGNTSADGTSSNGDRVAEHRLISDPSRIKFVHYQ